MGHHIALDDKRPKNEKTFLTSKQIFTKIALESRPPQWQARGSDCLRNGADLSQQGGGRSGSSVRARHGLRVVCDKILSVHAVACYMLQTLGSLRASDGSALREPSWKAVVAGVEGQGP